MDNTQNANHPIVLFDGDCRFCNASVNFIIDRDREAVFRFAPLQSELGRELMRSRGLDQLGLDSLVLFDGAEQAVRSTAGLRIARRLPAPWCWAYVFMVVPRPIRDWAYRCLARWRYRLFGRQETCRIPTPQLRERFLA